jgi:alpha-glucosidase (family GH31 glycosyl hydrolase)
MKKTIILLAGALLLLSSCKQTRFNDEQFKFKIEDGKILVSNIQTAYQIEAFRSDIIKTTFLPDPNADIESSTDFIILEKEPGIEFKVEEFEDKLHLRTEEIIVEITKSPFVVNYFNHEKEPILITSKTPTDSSGYKTMYFYSHLNENFYGMGQKSIPVNRRGYAFDTRNYHVGGYTKEYATMQVNIPYVYSSNNYGVFFDNTYTGYFDLAKSNPKEWSYRTDGGEYAYFVTTGENLQALQKNYYDLTGYPTIPPKWTLGLMQSKCGYIDETEVYSVVEQFEKYNLPLDAIILDAYWFGGYGEGFPQNMGNFTWLEEHFPNPEAYMNKLKEKGIKTLTINEPQINVNSENHDFLVEKDWLMKVNGEPFIQESFWAGSASLLDLTNPEAQDWLWENQKANVELGLDAFWVDLTEPDVSTPEGQFYAGPEPKIHNIYSFLFAKTLWDGFKNDYPERRLFNITRAGTAGMQRMGAVHWSGDAAKTFSALKLQIPMLIGCAMSGMPHYSSDIGGFTNAWDTISVPWTEYKGGPGVTTPELYTRWFQFGVFSPSLRPHSGEGQSCEPFAFDEKTLKITSKYLGLRYELIPYLYSYAYKTATTGEQLIKPLFMCFDDEEVANRDFEYMFGDMVVAPVIQSGQDKREVYLPKLDNNLKWVDFWDNKEYEGGKTYIVDAPIEKIPVFVKGGSIIVTGKQKKYVEESPDDILYLKIYPGVESEFLLYEDDGISMGYRNSEYKKTHISASGSEKSLKISIEPSSGEFEGMIENRTWIVQINQVSDVAKIQVDGEKANFEIDKTKNMVELRILKNTQKPITIDMEY